MYQDDELKHYGIPGMKWGVRKAVSSASKAIGKIGSKIKEFATSERGKAFGRSLMKTASQIPSKLKARGKQFVQDYKDGRDAYARGMTVNEFKRDRANRENVERMRQTMNNFYNGMPTGPRRESSAETARRMNEEARREEANRKAGRARTVAEEQEAEREVRRAEVRERNRLNSEYIDRMDERDRNVKSTYRRPRSEKEVAAELNAERAKQRYNLDDPRGTLHDENFYREELRRRMRG